MPSGFDGVAYVERHGPFQDLEYARFVDEDFIGRTLDLNKWRTQIAGGGSAAIVDDAASGILRIITGNVGGNDVILDFNNIRQVDPTLRPVYVVYAKMASVAIDTIHLRIGLLDAIGVDHCIFWVDRSTHGSLSIFAQAMNAGAQTRFVDTLVDLDANWHTYALYIDENGKPYWFIDGVLLVTGANADIDPTEFFQPYVELTTEDVNPKTLDVDAVKGWQKRV
jgi:hypothetical protein